MNAWARWVQCWCARYLVVVWNCAPALGEELGGGAKGAAALASHVGRGCSSTPDVRVPSLRYMFPVVPKNRLLPHSSLFCLSSVGLIVLRAVGLLSRAVGRLRRPTAPFVACASFPYRPGDPLGLQLQGARAPRLSRIALGQRGGSPCIAIELYTRPDRLVLPETACAGPRLRWPRRPAPRPSRRLCCPSSCATRTSVRGSAVRARRRGKVGPSFGRAIM